MAIIEIGADSFAALLPFDGRQRVRRTVRSIVAAIVFLAAQTIGSALCQQTDPALQILSKQDAQILFAMTKEQWLANLHAAVAAGSARQMGSADVGFGMATTTDQGDLLIVRPSYRGKDLRPEFIQVTVGYRNPRASSLNDDALQEAIQTAKLEMAPEYEVFGTVERFSGGVSIFFIVTEKKK